MVQGRVDGFAMPGDASPKFDEARDPAAPGPAEPGVQQLLAFGALEGEDLPELLLEQVGPEQLVVDLRDPVQLGLLPVGEVLWVFPQRVAGALEVAGVHAHPTFAGGVPGVASDLVHGIAGPRDDVEGIGAVDCAGAVRGDLISDALRRVDGDVSDCCATTLTQGNASTTRKRDHATHAQNSTVLRPSMTGPSPKSYCNHIPGSFTHGLWTRLRPRL